MIQTQYVKIAKKTWEVFAVGMGFGQNMGDGESIGIEGSSVTIVDVKTGVDVTADLIGGAPYVQGDNMLVAILAGGTSGTKYCARFRAYITADKKLQEDLVFVVRD